MQAFTKTYKNNTHLFYENDRSKELYIIQAGTVKVYRKIAGKDVMLALLSVGAVLGEMALIDGKLRSASAIAIEETKTIVIDAETFYKKITGVPPWFLSMIRTTCSKIRKANSRLEAIQNNNYYLHAVLALRYLLLKSCSVNGTMSSKSLPIDLTVTHLMQLLSINNQSIVKIFDLLQALHIIDIRDNMIMLVDEAKLVLLCEYLRNVFRKAYEKMSGVGSHIHTIVRSIEPFYNAQKTVSEKGKEINVSDMMVVLSAVNNCKDKNSLVAELRELGILCTVKVSSVQADASAFAGYQFFIVPLVFEKYCLFNAFNNVVPVL